MAAMKERLSQDKQRSKEDMAAMNERLFQEKQRSMEGLARLETQRSNEMEQRLREEQLQYMEREQRVAEERQRELYLAERARRANRSRETIIQPILNNLLDAKLVAQTDDISFSLNNEEFIVNDKKQPQKVFESFRDSYIHSPGDYIKYSKHKGEEMSNIRSDK
ncbi:MAG TPA: hypothetical protein VGM31_14820, partial [Puia sp.]|jgi:hypothetical protein